MIHSLLSLAFCIPVVFLGAPWPLLFWPALLYAGREHAQAEERWMRARNLNREKSPWWCGFAASAWTAKSLLDFLLPLAACLACAVLQWRLPAS